MTKKKKSKRTRKMSKKKRLNTIYLIIDAFIFLIAATILIINNTFGIVEMFGWNIPPSMIGIFGMLLSAMWAIYLVATRKNLR